jgi:hypothetical protein
MKIVKSLKIIGHQCPSQVRHLPQEFGKVTPTLKKWKFDYSLLGGTLGLA